MILLVALGLALLVALVYGLVVAYPAMLLFGAVHSFLPIIPAFGFWQTVAIVLLTRLLFTSTNASASD
jgi:hypothetical protein